MTDGFAEPEGRAPGAAVFVAKSNGSADEISAPPVEQCPRVEICFHRGPGGHNRTPLSVRQIVVGTLELSVQCSTQ